MPRILDSVTNFAKTTINGINAAATTGTLANGAVFPQPGTGDQTAFNAVIWNSTDYTNPSDDPDKEIVRVTARTGNAITFTRAQEGTAAVDHNTGGKIYSFALTFTQKTIDDINNFPNSDEFILQLTGNTSFQEQVNSFITSVGSSGTGTKIAIDTTQVSESGTNETIFYTVNIPGGTLGTNNAIRFKVLISTMTISNSPDGLITIRMKYGATTIATVTADIGTIASTQTFGGVWIEGMIIANNADDAQKGYVAIIGGDGVMTDGVVTMVDYGTAAIDSSSDEDLVITAQCLEVGDAITAEAIVVEKISSGDEGIASGFTFGDTVRHLNGSAKSVTGSMTLLKSITINSPVQFLRIKTSLTSSDAGTGINCEVRLNGSTVIGSRSGNAAGGASFNTDYNGLLKPGDVIGIYAEIYIGGGTATIDKVELCGTFANKYIYYLIDKVLINPIEINEISTVNTISATNTLV